MSAQLGNGTVTFGDGTVQSTAFISVASGLNIVYSSTTISENATYTLPTNCLFVFGYINLTWAGNTAGIANIAVRNSSNTVLANFQGGASSGNDGGSGSSWQLPITVPISSTATNLYVTRASGGNGISFSILGYVTSK
jgi:hypothetical protein